MVADITGLAKILVITGDQPVSKLLLHGASQSEPRQHAG
jgi:hypothetical protein